MGKWVDKAGLQYAIDWFKGRLAEKVDIVVGKGLSQNDFTDEDKQKLNTIAPGANNYTLPAASSMTLGGIKLGNGLTMDNNGVVSVTGGSGGAADSVSWANVENKPNSLAGYGIEDAVTTTQFNALSSKVTGAYKYAGSVANAAALVNIANPANGDIYNVEDTGMNYAWNADEEVWDSLGMNIDLSNYAQQSDLTALSEACNEKISSVEGADDSIEVTSGRQIAVKISTASNNALQVIETKGEEGLFVPPAASTPQNEKLIFGGYGHFVYDGTAEVTVPIYTGQLL